MDSSKHIVGMIFAAGLGTRLVPFTHTMPKSLVPVDGVPMLQRVLEKYAEAGIRDIVINIHHHADKIRNFLKVNDNFGLRISLSDETDCLLDTGGGILYASHFFDGADGVLVHNADILTDFDLNEMLNYHFAGQNDATLLVAHRETRRYLYFDKVDKRLKGWHNISTSQVLPEGFMPDGSTEPLAFGGVHVISPAVLSALSEYSTSRVFSIIPFYVSSCNSLNIRGYIPSVAYQWYDIGTPEKLKIAEEGFKKSQV